MKCVFVLCAALAAGCASSGSVASATSSASSASVQTTSASMARRPGFVTSKGDKLEAAKSDRSLRATAAWKSRCESGDDSACLVAGSFAR